MSPKFQKRSALKLVGRIIPEAKHSGIMVTNYRNKVFEARFYFLYQRCGVLLIPLKYKSKQASSFYTRGFGYM